MATRTLLQATEQQTEEVILAIEKLTEQVGTTGFQIASAINRLATAVAPIDRDFESWKSAQLFRMPPNGKTDQLCALTPGARKIEDQLDRMMGVPS